ncbi:hypothetical protein F5984_21220 [Rudanella paleaurantiibacter]|uniref:WbqC family protein n=1 Tax=Rudanella paleaurantiibacter TaxID=2614655 RepID=A0A7J5TUD1_9BACT|nr:hypothetical protein F5984_21220 [Rudanella paleaurantiibacter]
MENNTPSRLLIELPFLPCLDFFVGMLTHDEVHLEAHEQYQKQSYRNRCYVLTANKIDCLTVPVAGATNHQPIREVRIDNGTPWQQRHWRCLESAYRKAPFFEYYAPQLEAVYRREWEFLFDVSWEMLTICRQMLGIKTPLLLTEWYQKNPPDGTFDARSRMNAKNPPDKPLFYHPEPYMQNFGPHFAPNLSIVDLLFCAGPDALDVLRKSRQ